MRLKRTFKCSNCGVEFEMEADAFIPGVYGVMYDNDGKPFYFIDPTTEHLCQACTDIFERVMVTLMARHVGFKAEYDRHGYNSISFGCTDEFYTLLSNSVGVKPDNECGLGPKEEQA